MKVRFRLCVSLEFPFGICTTLHQLGAVLKEIIILSPPLNQKRLKVRFHWREKPNAPDEEPVVPDRTDKRHSVLQRANFRNAASSESAPPAGGAGLIEVITPFGCPRSGFSDLGHQISVHSIRWGSAPPANLRFAYAVPSTFFAILAFACMELKASSEY